ncbi:MAG: adenylate/guanylate cyclase domain-containing protein [Pseudonocardiaceae bacterium]|nr:adenylate/guanylate cyclase domain-containing protein [Pseudonocardiaceae bacterium]
MTDPVARFLPLPGMLRAVAEEVDFERAGLLDGLDRVQRRIRLALLGELARAGVSLAEMNEAIGEDRLGMLLLERTLAPQGTHSESEVAELAGVDPGLLRRWFRALGRPSVDGSEPAYDDTDVELARRVREYLELGLPEDGMLTVARAIGRGMASMADAAGSLLGEALLQAGDPDPELALQYAAQSRLLVETDAPLLTHILALNLAERIRSHAVGVADRTGGRIQGAQEAIVCFADLVGFTRLGEEIPADELGLIAEHLAAIVTDVVEPPVRLVKTIGDAVMLVAPQALPMVRTVLDVVDAAHGELPPLRVGIAAGVAVPHGGDWYGPPVNLASRVTASARPATVLATDPVRRAAEADDLRWRAVGVRRFKGVRGNQRIYRVRRAGDGDAGIR